MQSAEQIKAEVKDKYGKIAEQSRAENAASCCGATGCCDTVDYEVFAESYEQEAGYVADADLGLGCGIPTQFAQIKAGDTVVDLGSGAGNDAFVTRAITGESGRVIGVDMTEAMITKANMNLDKLGFNNVQFRLGEIENLPIAGCQSDVIISNCVLNLVPDKSKAFAEMFRISKPHGRFCVSDVVLEGELPEEIKNAAEMYVGCVSGALQKDDYLDAAKHAGFQGVDIVSEKTVHLPDEILADYMSAERIAEFRETGGKVLSVTVVGTKPQTNCC